MENKLKTLKEIYPCVYNAKGFCGEGYICSNCKRLIDLRAEAIKWVNKFDTKENLTDYNSKYWAFREFFNLTEEDLK